MKKNTIESTIQKINQFLIPANQEAVIAERDNILDSALPQGGTKFAQSLAHPKLDAIHKQSKDLIHDLEMVIHSDNTKNPRTPQTQNELVAFLAKIKSHEAKYQSIKKELRNHIRSIKKLNKVDIENKAEGLIKQYSSDFFNNNSQNIAPQVKTWETLKPKIDLINDIYELTTEKYAHHQFSKTLNPNPADFCNLIVSDFTLRINEKDIAHLARARLTDMSQKEERARAAIEKIEKPDFASITVYDFDEDQLKFEVIKLLIHEQLYPKNKNLWLGTGRDINAWKNKFPGQGVYLNCDDNLFTWGLNRAYMKIAGQMEYNLVFIQRPFPNIQKAILSRSSAQLLMEYLREIRPNIFEGSMYCHEDSLTYTGSEIWALLDMGFIPSLGDDGLIRMQLPRSNSTPVSKQLVWSVIGARPKRSHSAEPSYSLEIEDRTPKEIKRIFATPGTTEEKSVANAVDKERVSAYFNSGEEMGDEIDEPPIDLAEQQSLAQDLREKISAFKQKPEQALSEEVLRSIGFTLSNLERVNPLVDKIKTSYKTGLPKKTIKRDENAINTIIQNAEKMLHTLQTNSTIQAARKLKSLNVKCSEKLDFIDDAFKKMDLAPQAFIKSFPSIQALPTVLLQYKSGKKFDLNEATEIFNMYTLFCDYLDKLSNEMKRLADADAEGAQSAKRRSPPRFS